MSKMCHVFEPEFLRSWPFAFTHFSTIVATFCGLWQIGVRPHASQIGFLQSPGIVQISCMLSFMKCGLLLSSFMECYLAMSYLTYFIFKKISCLYFLHFGGYFMFCYRYFVSSWNQIGILHWKWVLISVMVLLVLISLEHQDCCSLSNFLLYKLMWTFSNDTCYLWSSVNKHCDTKYWTNLASVSAERKCFIRVVNMYKYSWNLSFINRFTAVTVVSLIIASLLHLMILCFQILFNNNYINKHH